MDLSFEEIAIRLLVATVLSGLIGLEREVRQKPAGIRTNALVGLGAAAMTMSGIYAAAMAPGVGDPTRVASVVVQGIGFLGAGAVIQASGSVRGLTTAATLWVVAGIGIAVGFGLYTIGLFTALVVLVLLAIFGPIDAKLMGEENGNGGTKKGWLFKKK